MADEVKPRKEEYGDSIEVTAVALAKMILTKFEAEKEFLILESFEKAEPIKKAAFIEKSTDFSIEVMQEISKSDMPFPYASRGIDKLILVLESLKQYIEGSITQYRHELNSRFLGVKDKENGRYTEEESTVGNLLLKLQEVRDSQGNVKSDYFAMPATPDQLTGENTTNPPAADAGLSTPGVAPEKPAV